MRKSLLFIFLALFFILGSGLSFAFFYKSSYIEPVSAKKIQAKLVSDKKELTTPTPTLVPVKSSTNSALARKSSVLAVKITPTPSPAPDISIESYILKQINEYRSSQGLSAVTNDPLSCGFARTRAEEISKNFNHDGFRQRIDSKSLPYQSYSEITENISMNSDYKQVVPNWINSSGHAENMRKDTPFVCVIAYGNFYAYEGWRP